MRTIETEIVIAAPPPSVWAVLTAFAAHDAWDPFIASIDGEPSVGTRLTVRFRKGMTFRPTVTEADAPRALEWLGQLGAGWLFGGRHRFELVKEGEGTRFLHSERFTGILVPLLGRTLAETERGFRDFNAALKERVEQRA